MVGGVGGGSNIHRKTKCIIGLMSTLITVGMGDGKEQDMLFLSVLELYNWQHVCAVSMVLKQYCRQRNMLCCFHVVLVTYVFKVCPVLLLQMYLGGR